MKSPKSLDIAITNQCNLRCKYCSHFTSAGEVEGDLPAEEWLRFFDELGRLAVMSVCLQGAEAFFRRDLPQIIEGIVRNRMRFSVLSNGTLITDELAAFLASTGRCDSVQVSIDGSIPTTHDAIRGEGSFLRAVEGVRRLMAAGVPTAVRVTIHRGNVQDLESAAALLLDEIGLPGFSTNSAEYMGLCRQNADQLLLTPPERSAAMETLLKLVRRYGDRISANAGPLAEARTWLQMEKARQEGGESQFGQGRLSGCGGTMSKMGVRADGVMVPCIQMSHVELGRINRDDLATVWRDHPELARIRRRQELRLRDFEFCRGCDYVDYCTGNCPAIAYTVLGLEDHPAPDACLRRFLEGGGWIPDESLLAAAQSSSDCEKCGPAHD